MNNIKLGIIYMLIAIFTAFIVILPYREENRRRRRIAVIICILISEWVFCNAMKQFSASQEWIIFWHQAKYIAIVFIPVFLLLLSMEHTQTKPPFIEKHACLLFVLPFLTILLMISNPLHGLFRESMQVSITSIVSVHSKNGFWYLIHAGYSYLLIMASILLCGIDLVRQPQIYKKKPAIILAGIMIPSVINFLFDSNLINNKSPFEIAPLSFAVCILFVYYALYIYKPWDVIPIARNLIVENMDNPVILFDNSNHTLDVNNAASRLLNCQGNELIGRSITDYPLNWRDILNRNAGQGADNAVVSINGFEGEKFYNFNQLMLKDKKYRVIGKLIVLTDITELKEAMNRLEHLSLHDQVTGIKNRVYFDSTLKRIDAEENYPLGIVIGDVNGLKLANDAFGHITGDLLLQKAGETIVLTCGGKYPVARIGGDEFAIIMPGTDEKEVAQLIEAIKKNCALINSIPTPLSISFGFALKRDPQQDIQEIIKKADEMMYKQKKLESSSVRTAMILTLKNALGDKNIESHEHLERTRQQAVELGRAICLPNHLLDDLSLLAWLHDAGKLAMPDHILLKSTSLNDEEWKLIRKHPEQGYHIASAIPELTAIAEAILYHHERWDGSGYPYGLKGEEIPLLARIITVVDAFDVMTHHQPYQSAINEELALNEINNCAGSHFDPYIAEVFINMRKTQGKGKASYS